MNTIYIYIYIYLHIYISVCVCVFYFSIYEFIYTRERGRETERDVDLSQKTPLSPSCWCPRGPYEHFKTRYQLGLTPNDNTSNGGSGGGGGGGTSPHMLPSTWQPAHTVPHNGPSVARWKPRRRATPVNLRWSQKRQGGGIQYMGVEVASAGFWRSLSSDCVGNSRAILSAMMQAPVLVLDLVFRRSYAHPSTKCRLQ